MADYRTTSDGRTVETRRRGGAGWLIALLIVVALVVAAFAFGLIDIDQTRSAKLPDVEVETKGGQAPKFDVDTADVDVGSKKETIEVPTIDVDRADNPNKKD